MVSSQTVEFSPCLTDWQYASGVAIAGGAYTSVRLTLQYDYNANTAYFDGIQLFKEQFGHTYDYDEDGTIKSVTDLQNQRTDYEFDENNDLVKTTLPNDAILTYKYDDYHNVIQATTGTGIVYAFEYDDWGNNTQVSITSGDVEMVSKAEYTSDGNRLDFTTDAAGKKTYYGYDAKTNVLEWVKAPEDTEATRTEYTYDKMYRMASAAVTTDTGLDLSASYTYTDDLLTQIQTESTTYGFTYGVFGLRTSVKAGDTTLARYTYSSLGLLQHLEYGNRDTVTYIYDDQDRLVTEMYEDSATVKYEYDNDGGLAKVTDSETGITSTYYYDFIDRLCHYSEEAEDFSLVMKYTFDEMDNISLVEEIIDGSRRTTRVAYDDDQRISWIRKATVKETYTYDAYSRVTNKATTQSDEPRLTEQIVYRIPATGSTSGQVSYMTVTAAADGGYSNTFSYSYDANGNITDVISGGYLTSYTYDTQNQLIREDNQAAGKSWTWTYDNAGNILSRSEYAYTTGTLGTAVNTIDYVYSTGTWGDLLLTYDGVGITYDEIGNPLTMGSRTYTWKHGRELATLTEDGTTWTYTYNADGLRTKRTNGTNTYHYVYADGQLVKAIANDRGMRFSYDASGTPMAVYYAGSEYYYVTNLQGDVVAILDYSGVTVVTYTYDAWGKILSTGGSMASTLGVYNPLRYRGYVYDRETGLYYLQSRYYDPEIGRFISADAYASTGQGVIGSNMFTYCLNSPINCVDPSGYIAVFDDILVVGTVAAVIIVTLILFPPPEVKRALTRGINAIVTQFADAIGRVGKALFAKTKGKENVRDSGLAHESDEEVSRKAHDKSLPKSIRKKYIAEEKARKLRNKRKRLG